MLAYDRIIELSKRVKLLCEERNILFTSTMITNGILLTKERAKELNEACNLEKVQITLDGTKEEYCRRKNATHKQFNAVLQNIMDCAQILKINVRLNCDKNNYEELLQITKLLLSKQQLASRINIYLAPITDYRGDGLVSCMTHEETDEYIIRFEKWLDKIFPGYRNRVVIPNRRKIFCELKCISNMAIGPNGELYKCEHDFGDENKIVGNVKDGLYYNKFFYDFMSLDLTNKCKKCKLLPICMGGCPAITYDFKKEDCNLTEKIVKFKIKNKLMEVEHGNTH